MAARDDNCKEAETCRIARAAEGWLQGETAWGHPADVLVAPDGSLLVSDDRAGAVYRIRYRGR
jgi:glucose/arabinose dehydrogenase